MSMKTRIVAVVAAAALGVVAVAVATAGPPLRFSDGAWNETFQAPWLSDHCGVPVYITIEGKAVRGTLHTNREGLVVREKWTMPAATITFFSPADEPGGTGLSFRSPDNGLEGTFIYPDGATLDGPAMVRVTGFGGHAGNVTDAGLIEWEGTVFGFDGPIPLVGADWDNPVRVTGSRPSEEEIDGAVCASLGGALTL